MQNKKYNSNNIYDPFYPDKEYGPIIELKDSEDETIESMISFYHEILEDYFEDDGLMIDIINDARDFIYSNSSFPITRDFILKAVKKDGVALGYASDELKNDKEVVLEAVKNYGMAFYYVSDELKNDKEVVLEAVKNDGLVIYYASAKLKDDKEIALEAVKNTGLALEFISEELKNDKEVVLEAVKNDCRALEFATEILKGNTEFIAEINAIKNKKDEQISSIDMMIENKIEYIKTQVNELENLSQTENALKAQLNNELQNTDEPKTR